MRQVSPAGVITDTNAPSLTPASSVVSETAFAQASAVGASLNYARQDHTHGTPAAPTASSVGLGSVTNDAQAKADFSGYTSKTTPVDADTTIINDSAASGAVKKLTWANLKATLKTYFDTLYQTILTFTGTGDVVRATSPALVTPTGIVKGDVGLGNVDNTSDTTKNAAVATLTNKAIALGSNTVTGTTAQFNTALTDNDFATLAGSETLTNKTLTTPTIGSFTNATHNHTNAAGGGQLTDAALSAAVSVAKGGTGDTGTAWTSHTPTVTAGSGTFTTVSATIFYKVIGKTCFIRGHVVITNNGTAGAYIVLTLPVTPKAGVFQSGGARNENTSKTCTLGVASGPDLLYIHLYDGTYPGATGQTIDFNTVIELA